MGNDIKRLKKLYSEYEKEHPKEQIVLGLGNSQSNIMLVGEAPGRDEVRQGEPFVGVAGGKLSEFMNYLKLERDSVFITNAIKHRLYKTNEKTGRTSNRPAKVSEIKKERLYLLKEIEIISPALVITLGNVPLKAVTGDFNLRVGEEHGRIINYNDINIFPMYHPASLIYNRKLEEVYYEDLEKLKAILKEVG